VVVFLEPWLHFLLDPHHYLVEVILTSLINISFYLITCFLSNLFIKEQQKQNNISLKKIVYKHLFLIIGIIFVNASLNTIKTGIVLFTLPNIINIYNFTLILVICLAIEIVNFCFIYTIWILSFKRINILINF
jgi:hypothetical protein